MTQQDPPAALFTREDESADELFYQQPRFVTHIDPATVDALTAYYAEVLAPGADVLDLMSSWVSHLPPEPALGRVSGLGMNAEELDANPQLTDWWVQNLNDAPTLEQCEQYDAVLCAVSVQYLTQPVAVMRSVLDALRIGGEVHIAVSHRCFPTKAIAAFRQLEAAERLRLVGYYLDQARFRDIELRDRSPRGADPLWILTGRK